MSATCGNCGSDVHAIFAATGVELGVKEWAAIEMLLLRSGTCPNCHTPKESDDDEC